jgi:hypothetical protein
MSCIVITNKVTGEDVAQYIGSQLAEVYGMPDADVVVTSNGWKLEVNLVGNKPYEYIDALTAAEEAPEAFARDQRRRVEEGLPPAREFAVFQHQFIASYSEALYAFSHELEPEQIDEIREENLGSTEDPLVDERSASEILNQAFSMLDEGHPNTDEFYRDVHNRMQAYINQKRKYNREDH